MGGGVGCDNPKGGGGESRGQGEDERIDVVDNMAPEERNRRGFL